MRCLVFLLKPTVMDLPLSSWLVLLLFTLSRASQEDCFVRSDAECCRGSLRLGQFYCTSPRIDVDTQSEADCTPEGLVNVSCYAAPNVPCICPNGRVIQYNASQCVFQQVQRCRFVEGRRYDYRVAVALSLFLGMFGIDRFYLGYPAIGLLKFCTLGFFFIGHLIDFLLILVQVVGPADRTAYYAPFYGPLVSEVNTTGLFMAGSGPTTCHTMS